jgi:hypothetical protein
LSEEAAAIKEEPPVVVVGVVLLLPPLPAVVLDEVAASSPGAGISSYRSHMIQPHVRSSYDTATMPRDTTTTTGGGANTMIHLLFCELLSFVCCPSCYHISWLG